PTNPALGLPTIHATVTLLHPTTGVPVAILDGTAITAKRTAAASALAAKTLALPGVRTIAVLGAGQQALSHIRALHAAIDSISFQLWAPRHQQQHAAALTLTAEGITVDAVPSIRHALNEAMVVVTATRATEPLFDAEDLRPGAVVISVGSFEDHRCEIGLDTLQSSSDIVVDHTATAEAHAGPIVHMRAHGDTRELTDLGAVLTGTATVRESTPKGIVTYLSVGLGVQDAAAAWAIYDKAHALGLYTEVPW
ncbi:MAG: ornithine cyclodeaminase family protein, partial [Comamonadaceae bacterium]